MNRVNRWQFIDAVEIACQNAILEAQERAPGIRDAEFGVLVPNVVAANDGDVVLFDKFLLLTGGIEFKDRLILIAMIVIGRFVRDEEVAV